MEIEGLLPSRYDAIFWLGVFIFIFGVIAFIAQPIVGIILLKVSPFIEGDAIHLESKHKGKAITGTFGNVIAIFWMALQIFITVLLISTLLR